MITYSDIKRYENVPFEQYRKLGGYSFSFLKREVAGVSPEFIASDKVKLGSLVDAILMQPEEADISSPLWNDAVKIASHIRSSFGTLLPAFKSQRSYTGVISHAGLSMCVTGRTDWEIDQMAVIDLKVTSAKTDAQFKALVTHMGYDNQQWNYARLAGAKAAYLMPYSSVAKKPLSIVKLPITSDYNEFWASKILKFGE